MWWWWYWCGCLGSSGCGGGGCGSVGGCGGVVVKVVMIMTDRQTLDRRYKPIQNRCFNAYCTGGTKDIYRCHEVYCTNVTKSIVPTVQSLF